MRVRRGFVVLLVIALCGVASCGGSSGTTGAPGGSTPVDDREATPGGSATVLGPEVRSLDPALVINSATAGSTVLNAVYDVLYTVDQSTNELQPRLATGFESSDGLTWVLTLRDGLTFSDGSPLDAEAVRVNWQRCIDMTKSPANPQAQQIASMSVTSPTELRVTLKEVNRQFFQVIPFFSFAWIASPASIQSAGADFGNGANVIGAGPFTVVSRAQNSETVLERNAGYWREGLPKLDRLTFRPVADQQQGTDTVVAGGADADVWVSTQLAAEAADQGVRSVVWGNLQGGANLLLNQNTPPFDDLRARKAVSLALDIQNMIDVVFQGYSDKVGSLFQESSPFYDAEYTFAEPDRTEAQRLFDELAQERGGPLEFDMVVSNNSVNTTIIKQLQSQLETFDNVTANVKVLDGADYGVSLYSGDFDAAMYAIASADPVPQFDQFSDAYPLDIAHLGSEEVDRAIATGRSATDVGARKAAYDTLQEVLLREYPEIFMFRTDTHAIYGDRTTGLVGYGQGSWLVESYGLVADR